MSWAHGKAILLGEHAVVYGYPALAGALDRGVAMTFVAHPEAGGLHLSVPAWRSLDVDGAGEHIVARAMRVLFDQVRAFVVQVPDAGSVDVNDPFLGLRGRVEVVAEIPAAAGLGSSAALCVALTRLLLDLLCPELAADDSRISTIADAGERCFHDNPSGVDVALATRGGVGMFVRGRGLDTIHAPPLCLAIGLSGEPRRTADMVNHVARLHREQSATTEDKLARLGHAAERGRRALERHDIDEIGALMTQAHRTLAELGVSTERLDDLVASAERAGALGAKLTGAGGGGAVIAAARDDGHAQTIANAWRARGFSSFTTRLGGHEHRRQ